MRKAIFAVMLVGASFAGGAVVNGPGLRWAQTTILSYLNSGDDEDDEKEKDEASDNEDAPKSTVGQEPLAPIPSTPIVPVEAVASATPSSKPEPDALKTESPRPESAIAKASALLAAMRPQAAAPTSPQSSSDKPLGLDSAELSAAPPELKSSNDPEIALTNVPTPLPEGPSTPQEPLDPLPPLSDPNASFSAKGRDKGQEPGWGDSPGSAAPPRLLGADTAVAPKPAPPNQEQEKNANALAVAAPRPASDWIEIRRRMAALGVSRYGIEGEPNGKVRFHCVIPLAGRRAVAQQFEAEGDDELQAAEVALRRVALWRATENPGP
ncbi:hypothetical protein V5E97_04540 [Singulisphaera sp. Ch08]|uniref:SPOR domain-containing protein n=1 Tax=Singulisphaera sp. Ch08 TaxID=3120278 RepID=A0AAU7CJW1_9BACT